MNILMLNSGVLGDEACLSFSFTPYYSRVPKSPATKYGVSDATKSTLQLEGIFDGLVQISNEEE
jgi:hypothetical protein